MKEERPCDEGCLFFEDVGAPEDQGCPKLVREPGILCSRYYPKNDPRDDDPELMKEWDAYEAERAKTINAEATRKALLNFLQR